MKRVIRNACRQGASQHWTGPRGGNWRCHGYATISSDPIPVATTTTTRQEQDIRAARSRYPDNSNTSNQPNGDSNEHNNHERGSFQDKFTRLEEKSHEFLNTYPTLPSTHQDSAVTQLLLHWGNLMPYLVNQFPLLHRAATCADALANVLMDTSSRDYKHPDGLESPSRQMPVASLVTIAVHAWAKVQQKDLSNKTAALKAEALLKRLIRLDDSSSAFTNTFHPNVTTYNGVLDAWAKSPLPEAPDNAMACLREMASSSKSVSPDIHSYNCVLNAYASRGQRQQASTLLQHMRASKNPATKPDVVTYGTFLKALQRSGDRSKETAYQAYDLFQQLMKSHRHKPVPRTKPNSVIFGTVISMVSFHHPEWAQKVLQEMMTWCELDRNVYQSFVTVMNGWAKRGEAPKVERLLLQMQECHLAGHEALRPTHKCFVIVLDAWAKRNTPESAHRAEAVLRQMEDLFLDSEDPNDRLHCYGYNVVMNAFVNSGDPHAPERVQEIVDRMIMLAQKHNNLNLLPDVFSYSNLIKVWILEQRPGYAHRAEELMRQMEEAQEANRCQSSKPDRFVFACVIDAWAKSGEKDAPERIKAILQQMIQQSQSDPSVAPNNVCFNTLIGIYSKAGDGDKAEAVLQWMIDEYNKGNAGAIPDTTTFNSCIFAWTKGSSPDCLQRAEKLFHDLVEQYKNGNVRCLPDVHTISTLMTILTIAEDPNTAERASGYLRIIEEFNIKLNIICYNALIMACARATGDEQAKREALQLAVTTFQEMQNRRVRADGITYKYLLQACHNHIANVTERQDSVEDLFHRCCNAGEVNRSLIKSMEEILSPDFLAGLIGDAYIDGKVQFENLPMAWRGKRNA